MKKYVAYYRVSTAKQGASGLGLEAQRASVHSYTRSAESIIAEYTEVESGKHDNREQLHAAISHAQRSSATLVIAKLDRLSRNAGFIFALRDSGVDFICADMPEANTLTIGIFATINNLLDVRYKTGGFEQARNANFRELNQDLASGTPAFAPRYFYGFGRTYFFNFYINL